MCIRDRKVVGINPGLNNKQGLNFAGLKLGNHANFNLQKIKVWLITKDQSAVKIFLGLQAKNYNYCYFQIFG